MLIQIILFATQLNTPPALKIKVVADGLHRIAFEELSAYLHTQELDSHGINLFLDGEPVPIIMQDGGDGRFQAGDAFIFYGHRPWGVVSSYEESVFENTYVLRFNETKAHRAHPMGVRVAPVKTAQSAVTSLTGIKHLEIDRLMMRFVERPLENNEMWYWAELKCTRKKPFELEIELSDLVRSTQIPTQFAIDVYGWSTRGSHSIPGYDHVLDITLNERPTSQLSWHGKVRHRGQVFAPPNQMRQGVNVLKLEVPYREHEGKTIVDIVVLNKINVEYPKNQQLGEGQHSWISAVDGSDHVSSVAKACILNSQGGFAWIEVGTTVLIESKPKSNFWAVVGSQFSKAAAIEIDQPSDLRSTQNQADYLIISHPDLMTAIEPLAQAHRDRGLSVQVIDVTDVYDEFSHGQAQPAGIKSFISHAFHSWAKPQPGYVLLVGDASWDTRSHYFGNPRYADLTYKWGTIPYIGYTSNDEEPSRNLIPSYNFFPTSGHSASDNWYVCVDGDDFYPDLAIGRFSLVTPAEVTGVVEKTLRYMNQPAGDWQFQSVWVTNESKSFQSRTEKLVHPLENIGYQCTRVFPSSNLESYEGDSQLLIDTWNRGAHIVNFIGHGGRFIWRTGPPDYKRNVDLFTLDDLDRLAPTDQLPVVISQTCYSAPFDHPEADSIGEKLLRMPHSGAIAVIGASWRNSPSMQMGQAFIDAFTGEGTIGEAFLAAKTAISDRTIVETYSLLGDPAVPLNAPQEVTELRWDEAAQRLNLTLPEGSWQRIVISWADNQGKKLSQTRGQLSGSMTLSSPLASWTEVRVVAYAEKRVSLGRLVREDAVPTQM